MTEEEEEEERAEEEEEEKDEEEEEEGEEDGRNRLCLMAGGKGQRTKRRPRSWESRHLPLSSLLNLLQILLHLLAGRQVGRTDRSLGPGSCRAPRFRPAQAAKAVT